MGSELWAVSLDLTLGANHSQSEAKHWSKEYFDPTRLRTNNAGADPERNPQSVLAQSSRLIAHSFFMPDIKLALRQFRKSPLFTLVAVATLAIGIGASTAIFTLLDQALIRTLPVSHPEQLVELLQKYPGEPRGNGYWSWPSYEHLRDNNHVFSAVIGTSIDNRAPGFGRRRPRDRNRRVRY